jgi:transposase
MGTNKRERRVFSTEYKADAVKLWRESGDSREEVAKRLGISGATLGKWIKQAEVDDGDREGLTSSERDRLRALEKENKVLRMERDLMKKAAAFFATDETK